MVTGPTAKVQSLSPFVWSIAEILRGDFKQSEYGKVIRLDDTGLEKLYTYVRFLLT